MSRRKQAKPRLWKSKFVGFTILYVDLLGKKLISRFIRIFNFFKDEVVCREKFLVLDF